MYQALSKLATGQQQPNFKDDLTETLESEKVRKVDIREIWPLAQQKAFIYNILILIISDLSKK